MMNAYKDPTTTMLKPSQSSSEQTDANHSAAANYMCSVMSPQYFAAGIPDTDTTPNVLKQITVRSSRSMPSVDFSVIPVFNSPNPHVQISHKCALATFYTPANAFVRAAVVPTDEQLALNYERGRLVGAVLTVESTLTQSGTTDVKGRIIAIESDGAVPYSQLSIEKLTQYNIGRMTDANLAEGIALLERPRVTPYQYFRGIGSEFVGSSNGRFGQARDYVIGDAAPTYNYNYTGTGALGTNAITGNIMFTSGTEYSVSIKNGNFPKRLSTSYKVEVDAQIGLISQLADLSIRVELIAVTAIASDLGVPTFTSTVISSGTVVKSANSDNLKRLLLVAVVNEIDGVVTPDGQTVAFQVVLRQDNSNAIFTAADTLNLTLSVQDLGCRDVERVSNTAIFAGAAPGTPYFLTGFLNFEAVPNDELRRQVKPSANFVGSTYTEAVLQALIGPAGTYAGNFTVAEYEAHCKDMRMGGHVARQTGQAYAASWGGLWKFLKPGLKALVPGVAGAISGAIGQRFNQSLTDFGNEAFAKSLGECYAASEVFCDADSVFRECYAADHETNFTEPSVDIEIRPDKTCSVKCHPCTVSAKPTTGDVQMAESFTEDEKEDERLYGIYRPGSPQLSEGTKWEPGWCYAMPRKNPVVTEFLEPPDTTAIPGLVAGEDPEDEEVTEAEEALSRYIEPQRRGATQRLLEKIGRGSVAAAAFRSLVAKGSIGHTAAMSAHLMEHGSHVAALVMMDATDSAAVNYGQLYVSKDLREGENADDYIPYLTDAGTQCYIEKRYSNEEVRGVIETADYLGMVHPFYRKHGFYMTYQSLQGHTKVTGSSHGAAQLLAIAGYSTDTVVSAAAVWDTDRFVLGPVGSTASKARFCMDNALKFITFTKKYAAGPAPHVVNQYDIDKGYKTNLTPAIKDQVAHDSIFSGQVMYTVNNYSTLLQLARDPRMIKGSDTESTLTIVKRMTDRDPSAAPVLRFDMFEEKINLRMTGPESVEQLVKALRTVDDTVFLKFEPVLNSIVGQIPWHTTENRPAEKGEKAGPAKLGIKPSFIKSLEQLRQQVGDKRAPKTEKTKKKGGKSLQPGAGLDFDDLLN